VWSTLGGESKAGKGVKVGVLDTGIWPEHPMFADPGIPFPGGGPYGCEFGLSGNVDDPAFACNDKLIGSYAFMDTNMAVNALGPDEYCDGVDTCSARDADGHGTHTASTAAGSPVDHAVLMGTDRGHISGIAPGASVIMYRVCGASTGCYSTDSMAAVEQAITDDVDVINFSISGGASPYSDGVELAFLDAYAAGILVNASAGNSGPGAATSDHGGPWVNTVGASTLDRAFETTLHLTADGGATLDVPGSTISGGVTSPTPVVLGADTVSGDQCTTEAGSGDYTGEVVVCRRGNNARIAKGYNISQGDAAGMILYNTVQTDVETDNHFLPAVHVNDPSSTIVAFVTGHTGVMATWTNGVPSAAQGDVMASFSSRGPLGDFIKPDVTAPGVQILAGESPKHLFAPDDGLGPNDELYQAIAGTSMSSPHAAGVAALIKAAHPSWTPGQIKSAMMTSSVQSVVKEDGVTPSDPFDRGAGSIRANRAVKPSVTFDVSVADYVAAGLDPFSRIDLNLASVNAPNMPGMITTTRTARNVTGVAQTIHITSTANITVSPSTITLGPWGTASFFITINGQKQAEGQYFGSITLDPVASGYLNAVLPVAWYKQAGDVALTNECDVPVTFVAQNLTIVKGETATCHVTVANNSSDPAAVSLKVKAPNTGRLIIKNWSDGNKKGNGFVWNGVLGPTLPPPIFELYNPDEVFGGWFDISDYVAGDTSYTDESYGNYDLPTSVVLGDEEYSTVGLTSDGYLVLGGATSQDVNYVPQDMPDSARPNNVLAPFWTDLNPADGGDINVYAFDDSDPPSGTGIANCYYLFEWNEIPVWANTPGDNGVESFQVWIMSTECVEAYSLWGASIAFDYDPAGMAVPGDSTPFIVGAENRLASSAATLGMDVMPNSDAYPDGGYLVITGPSTPGETYTIDYDAYGKKTGTFDVKAIMTTNVTQGTDYQIVRIKVVNP
jgi:subtilisin family serine protease